MGAGADDYIVKPFHQHELEVRLRAGKRILDLQAELLNAREELRERASKDLLTMLPNRSAVHDELEKELSRCHREGRSVGVMLLDLDHFKSINDRYGHFSGDAVLRETAAGCAATCVLTIKWVGTVGKNSSSYCRIATSNKQYSRPSACGSDSNRDRWLWTAAN